MGRNVVIFGGAAKKILTVPEHQVKPGPVHHVSLDYTPCSTMYELYEKSNTIETKSFLPKVMPGPIVSDGIAKWTDTTDIDHLREAVFGSCYLYLQYHRQLPE